MIFQEAKYIKQRSFLKDLLPFIYFLSIADFHMSKKDKIDNRSENHVQLCQYKILAFAAKFNFIFRHIYSKHFLHAVFQSINLICVFFFLF